MKDVKRYNIQRYFSHAYMEENINGNYVEYKDYKSHIRKLESQLLQSKTELAEAKKPISDEQILNTYFEGSFDLLTNDGIISLFRAVDLAIASIQEGK